MDHHQPFEETDYRNPYLVNINEKIISKLHKQAKKQNSVSGVWSDQENLTYAQFIEDHPYEFETAQKRRRFKVFQRMAMHLPNRTAIQCRSHNQKMVKLAGNILSVPHYIKRRIFPRGKKVEMPIQIKQQQNSPFCMRNIQKQSVTRYLNDEIQFEKQHIVQKSFDLPLKLCIEIKNENIASY